MQHHLNCRQHEIPIPDFSIFEKTHRDIFQYKLQQRFGHLRIIKTWQIGGSANRMAMDSTLDVRLFVVVRGEPHQDYEFQAWPHFKLTL